MVIRAIVLFLLSAFPAQAQNVLFPANPGDMIVKGTVGAWTAVPGGTAGCVLTSQGPTAAPTWNCALALNFSLPPMATNRVWGNISGVQGVPTQITATQFLDTIDYDIQRTPLAGSILTKSADNIWRATPSPAVTGWALTSQGTGQPPQWAPPGAIAVPGIAGTCLISNGPTVAPSYQTCTDAGVYLTIASAAATYQPLTASLTAFLAAGTGCIAHTGASTWAPRTITGTAGEITVTNGDCTAGNPTVSLPSVIILTGKTVNTLQISGSGDVFAGINSTSTGDSTGVAFKESGTEKAYVNFGNSTYPSWGGANSLNFINTTAAGPITFNTNSAEVARVVPGKIYVGRTTAPSQDHGKMVVGDGAPIGTIAGSGSDPNGMSVISGSAASPVSVNLASLMVNRTESLSGGATNTYSAAIVGEAHGRATNTSQATGVIGYATQLGNFDNVGVLGYAQTDTPGVFAAFGSFFGARASSATSGAFSIATGLDNDTGSTPAFNISGANLFVGIDVNGANGQAGQQIRGNWKVGYAVNTGAVSETAYISTGFNVDATGIVDGAGFKAAGVSGISATKTVRDAAGTGTCTLIFAQGILTGGTC